MYKIEVEKKLNNGLIKQWKSLWNTSDYRNYFNSVEWFKSCISIFDIKKYLIIKIYKEETLLCLIPLELKFKHLFSPGRKYLDKTTMLLKSMDKELINCLKEYLNIHNYSLTLKEVDQDLASLFSADILKEVASENPYIDLNLSINEIVKSKERRYLENIIKKNEKLSVKFYENDCHEYLDTIFKIEANSNKPGKHSDLFSSLEARKIFSDLSKTNFSLLTILYLNDKPIAHLFGIKNKSNNFMAYHMAYVEEFRKYQPGKIIIIQLIQFLKEKNYSVFDFSRGNSLLKKHFSSNKKINYSFYINPTLSTRLSIISRKVEKNMKVKIKKILRRYKG